MTLLRAVIDAVPDSIYCKDKDGRYLVSNRSHAERLAIPPGGAIGKTTTEITGPTELAKLFMRNDQIVFDSGKALIDSESTVEWPDGSTGSLLTSKYPLRNDAGEIVGLVGIGREITRQRAAEKALEDERTMLRTIIDAIADQIFLKDCAGRFLLVNAAYEELFGLPAQAVLGKADTEIPMMKDCSAGYAADDRFVIEKGLPVINREERFPQKDGTLGWFLTSKFPLRDTEGRVIGLVGVARNITAMRQAEEELADTRQRLLAHVENSPLAVIEWTPDFRVQGWNGQATAVFGWPAAEVVGWHFFDWAFVHPEDVEKFRTAGRRLIDGLEQRNSCQSRNLTRDGRTVHCVWHNSALRDATGKIVSLCSLVKDVSERVQAETTAREREQFCQKLIEATETGYVVLDEEGRLMQANAEYVRLTGHQSLEEVLGRRVAEWTAVHDRERNTQEVAKILAHGGTSHFEVDHLRADGTIIPIEVNARVVRSSRGREIIGLCRDISGRRAAESERQEIQRKVQETQKLESLGILAGGIAHDFNNLLTAVLGNATLAMEEAPAGSRSAEYLHQIELAAKRAADLCQQMLAYSGRGRFEVSGVNLNYVLTETADLLRVTIPKGASLVLDLAPDLPPIEGDATQLRQVIMNLVINAAEAINGGEGVVEIKTGVREVDADFLSTALLSAERKPGKYIFLEVTDTGCGMSGETRERIFDPFFTTKFTGRGLGLAAVLGIVRGHGGTMHVESAVGHGSTFTILMPVVAEGTGEATSRTASPEAWRGRGTALVVDDEASVRKTTSQMLNALGFEVDTAEDGMQAIELLQASPGRYATVVLDLTMPKLDGFGVLAEMRSLRPSPPVLMMSGYNVTEILARPGGHRPAAFLQKPFSFRSLREKLQALLPAESAVR
jgi:PAS domain S-box-containing protein